jgi:hypothetical protein
MTFVLLVAACGSDGAKAAGTPPPTTLPPVTLPPTTTTPPTTTIATGPPSLLNGMPTPQDADQERRVIAVKIDNHPEARPQSGPQEADAVIELIVEGGITRFIALFHTSDSDYVGPIRSGRPTDPTLLSPLGATFQVSGAQPWVLSLINGAGVNLLGEQRPNTFRIPRGSRAYERTLYGDTTAMREAADERGYENDPPPGPWFMFGDTPTPTTESAAAVDLSWSRDWPSVRWVWDGLQYLRFNGETPHEWVDQDEEGEQIAADTLLVLTATKYTASPGGGQGGSAVPALETVGEGTAYLFYGEGVVEGTWVRENTTDYFTLSDTAGDPMLLPAGRLWVSVFPNDRPITWE